MFLQLLVLNGIFEVRNSNIKYRAVANWGTTVVRPNFDQILSYKTGQLPAPHHNHARHARNHARN